MVAWTTCPSCRLKHTERPDGLCPRCRTALRAGSVPYAGPPAAPQPAPGPAAAQADLPGPVATSAAPLAPPAGAGPAVAPFPAFAPAVSGDAAPMRYAGAPGVFTIGQLLSGTFTTWFGTAGTVVGLAILVNLPTALLMIRAGAGMTAGRFGPFAAAMATSVLLAPLELLWITRAALRFQRGEKVELGDVLGASRLYLPALGALVLFSLAATLSAVTVIGVPFALFLSCAWVASVPAMAAEGLGSTTALQRSWTLTQGRRWEIFGAFFVLVMVVGVATIVFSALTGAVAAVVARAGSSSGRTAITLAQLLGTLVQGVVSTFLTTGTAVAYHQLRVAREGHDAGRLGQVFE